MNNRTLRQLVLIAALLIVSYGTCVKAEGILIKAEPKDKAELANFDGNIKLWFSGNISERSPTLVVVDGKGNRVDKGDMRLVIGERSRLTASTQALQAGPYVIRYRVITDDGLIVSGILKFTVKDGS